MRQIRRAACRSLPVVLPLDRHVVPVLAIGRTDGIVLVVYRPGDPGNAVAGPQKEVEQRREQCDRALERRAVPTFLLRLSHCLGIPTCHVPTTLPAPLEVDLPKVPLEAGLGPENPPCPICGEPIFPWLELPGGAGLARRCEECGLGILGEEGDRARLLADLERDAEPGGWLSFENRDSTQARFTGGGWAGLETDHAYRLTPDAVDRLMASEGRLVTDRRARLGHAIPGMWQSVINTFTFGHNVALGATGRSRSVRAPRAWQRALDWFITVVLSIPVLVLAIPLELIGATTGRCGNYAIRTTAG